MNPENLNLAQINALPHMPFLGSSNSAANKNMMSKFGQMGNNDLIE